MPCNNNIEIIQNSDPCNGKRYSTDCIIYPSAITYLDLPSDSTVTQVIDNLLLSLVDARNRIELLENLVSDLDARLTILET
jgi:hypothetical protein